MNSWVLDGKVRRDAIIALGLVLVFLTLLAWIVFANGGAVALHLATSLVSSVIGRVVVVGSAGAAGGLLWLRRHRRRAARNSASSTGPGRSGRS